MEGGPVVSPEVFDQRVNWARTAASYFICFVVCLISDFTFWFDFRLHLMCHGWISKNFLIDWNAGWKKNFQRKLRHLTFSSTSCFWPCTNEETVGTCARQWLDIFWLLTPRRNLNWTHLILQFVFRKSCNRKKKQYFNSEIKSVYQWLNQI